jgi:hypothetical protein
MIQRIRQWFTKKSSKQTISTRNILFSPKQNYSNQPQSSPPFDNQGLLFNPQDSIVTPNGLDPRILFPFLGRMRDTIPDVSAGVWAWVRLCSTPQSYSLSDCGENEQTCIREILLALDRRIACHQSAWEKGIESIVQSFFLSVFTYGCFCGEIVLDRAYSRIEKFIPIDPATIRFRLDRITREYHPFQIQTDGTLHPINRASFFYYGLDSDGLSPYGRSPLLALPLVIKLQQQMILDMSRAQHNAGYPTIHFKMIKPEKEQRESDYAYTLRAQKDLEDLETEVTYKECDSNLITFDNVEVQYIGPSGVTYQWTESLQAISEQVIAALHLAPFMIGRNWGTTQSWGNAQYQLITNNARTVQEGARRLAEWLRNIELALHEYTIQVNHHFAPHHHVDALDRAKAFQTTTQAIADLSNNGFILQEQAKHRINSLLELL